MATFMKNDRPYLFQRLSITLQQFNVTFDSYSDKRKWLLLQQEIFLLFYKCDLRAYEDGALQLMG